MPIWFRVDDSYPDSPIVARLADSLHVAPAHALGLLVTIEARMAAHAPNGDLYPVRSQLARWAGWTKKAEPFAIAVLAAVDASGTGVHHDWVRRNASHLAESERNAQRMRERRAAESAAKHAQRLDNLNSARPSFAVGGPDDWNREFGDEEPGPAFRRLR